MGGNLLKRCFDPSTGAFPREEDGLCSADSDCESGFICGKGMDNPNLGITSFDTIFYALLTVF